ncbi:MAG TPA: ABC transporter permease [Anaeromyxobacteraceae bacterium]|nr:ABC transporter permease [Anaeromyxobacteraceae bacterium]
MRRTLAIARKELEVTFTTPIAWVVLMLVAFVSALLFNGFLDAYRFLSLRALTMQAPEMMEQLNLTDAVISRLFAWVSLLVLLSSPFLSMRLFAEEKRARTFELLLTLPVRPVEIVLGKYLAALVAISAALAVALLYPVLLSFVAEGTSGGAGVEWQTVATGLLGIFLLGAMSLAVGMFASALTESTVVAALASLFVLGGLSVVPALAAVSEGPLKEVAMALSPFQHVAPFLAGRIELGSLVYFLSFAALGLYLSDRAVEGHRWV